MVIVKAFRTSLMGAPGIKKALIITEAKEVIETGLIRVMRRRRMCELILLRIESTIKRSAVMMHVLEWTKRVRIHTTVAKASITNTKHLLRMETKR
jgi:hypothetical protein